MTSFVNIGLVTAENIAWVMSYTGQFFEISPGGTSIVARENKNGIPSLTYLFQFLHDSTHHVVHLEYKITIEIGVAFTYKLFSRQYGSVGSRQRKIQTKRSIGFSLIADIICSLLSQMGQHLNVFKIRGGQSFSPKSF